MFKLCVFDMDGTVVNSIGDIAAAMNRSLEKLGHTPYSDEEYCHMVGEGVGVLCKKALPDGTDAEVGELIDLYKKDYIKNCCDKTVLYDGVEELIRSVKKNGVKCAMLSNKPHDQVLEISKSLFEEDLFDMILGQTDRFPAKPAPDSLFYVMDKLGASVENTAFIGDSNIDIRLGKAAKVYTVGVSWGFRGEKELTEEGADRVVKDAKELEKVLLG